MSRLRIGTWKWMEANPSRLAILNINYDDGGLPFESSFVFREINPWRVIRGAKTIHKAKSYEAAAEFLRNKLQEVS